MTLLKSIVVCLVLANVGYFLWAHGCRGAAAAGAGHAGCHVETGIGVCARARRRCRRPPWARPPGGTAAGSAVGGAGLDGAAAGGTAAAGTVAAGTTAAGGGSGAEPAGSGEGATPALLTNVKRCISVGPFRDVSEAAHAATTLRGGGYDPRQRVADGEVWAGVWVYVPLPSSRAAGDQMSAKLKAGGIDDALEMPGPNDGSVISLGLYSDSKRAQARVAQLQALGFNPAIADRKRTGSVYWIDIDLKPTDSLLNPADLQGDSGRIVRLEVKGCPPAAGAAP